MSRLALAAAFGAVVATPALAADLSTSTPSDPGYIVTLGEGGEFGPVYTGAKRKGFSPVPSFDFRAADEPAGFSAQQDAALDYSLVDNGRFAFGPAADARWGRSRHDMGHDMAGLRTTSTIPVFGAFAEYWLAPDALRTRAELLQGVGSSQGMVTKLSADVVQHFGPVTVSGGPRMSAANKTATNRDFGVTPAEAELNGHVSPFAANGGPQTVGVGLQLKVDVSSDTSLTLYNQYDKIVGDAARSPVVRKFGSANQTTFGLGLTHAFSLGGN